MSEDLRRIFEDLEDACKEVAIAIERSDDAAYVFDTLSDLLGDLAAIQGQLTAAMQRVSLALPPTDWRHSYVETTT